MSARRSIACAALAAALALGAARAGAAPGEHEVRPGENLAIIASRTLGDAQLWPAIYEANRDRIKDPARVYPGQTLAIPALDDAQREAARRQAEANPLRPIDSDRAAD